MPEDQEQGASQSSWRLETMWPSRQGLRMTSSLVLDPAQAAKTLKLDDRRRKEVDASVRVAACTYNVALVARRCKTRARRLNMMKFGCLVFKWHSTGPPLAILRTVRLLAQRHGKMKTDKADTSVSSNSKHTLFFFFFFARALGYRDASLTK